MAKAKAKAKRASKSSATRSIATRKRNPENATLAQLKSVGMTEVLPGVGSFLGTRVAGKLLRTIVGTRVAGGKYQRHFGPLGSILTFFALMYATRKSESVRRYKSPVLIGSGIAALVSLVQAYAPGLLSWFDLGALGALTPAAADAKRGLAGYANGRRKNGRTRFVSPGQIDFEKSEAEQDAEEDEEGYRTAEDSRSSAQDVDDEDSQQVIEDGNTEIISDEVADVLQGNEELSDLYDGIFSP